MKTKTLVDNMSDVESCLTCIMIEIDLPSGALDEYRRQFFDIREHFRYVSNKLLLGEPVLKTKEQIRLELMEKLAKIENEIAKEKRVSN